MPFGRSHARNKSRSPAVGSPAILVSQSSRPPTFLPPSHYAAAAGLPYPRPSREPSQNESSVPSYPTQSPAEETPVVESSESQTSQSSTMGRLMRRVSSKRFTVSLTRSESRAEREKDPTEQHNSQFTDIPLLETQLLPSLKDTVDRMTQSPQPRSNSRGSPDGHSTPSSRSSTSRRLRREDRDRQTSPSTSSLPPPVAHTSRSTGELNMATGIPRFIPASSPGPKSVLKSPARRNTPTQSHVAQPTPISNRSRVDQSDSFRGLYSGSETNVRAPLSLVSTSHHCAIAVGRTVQLAFEPSASWQGAHLLYPDTENADGASEAARQDETQIKSWHSSSQPDHWLRVCHSPTVSVLPVTFRTDLLAPSEDG